METNTFISKFETNTKVLYGKVQWKNNVNELFQIQIFDGEQSWSGRFSREFAEKYRERVDESKEQYSEHVKQALEASGDEFVYDFAGVINDNVAATFSWKRKFEDGALMMYGSVPVHQDDLVQSKDLLIEYLLNENNQLRLAIKNAAKTNERLTADLDKYKFELEKFINSKTALESTLYGKFIQLLNAKKRRIQLLEENLTKCEGDNTLMVDSDID